MFGIYYDSGVILGLGKWWKRETRLASQINMSSGGGHPGVPPIIHCQNFVVSEVVNFEKNSWGYPQDP